MKKVLTSIALMLTAVISNAQTTATNFTITDCNSTSHTLFTDLNNGKIVVLVWVMPCSMCNTGAKKAYDAVQSFATSNPGKVLYYLMDDAGDNTCSELTSFATASSVGPNNLIVSSNSGAAASESNYGGSGMPHVVVVGGMDHKIYFNKLNGAAADQPGITSAISSAITTTGINEVANQISFSVSPNPASDKVTINYSKAVEKITITALNGQVVKEVTCSGVINPSVSLSGIANGVYMVKVTNTDGVTGTQKIVKE